MLSAIRKMIDLQWPLSPLRPFAGLYNPFDLDFRQDPYTQLDRLRSAAPVYYSKPIGSFLVSTYDGAMAVLGDRRFTSDRKKDTSLRNRVSYRMMNLSPSEEAAFDATLVGAPDDVHQRMRAAIRHDFSRGRIEGLKTRIDYWVDHLLDPIASRGHTDLIADFAGPLPLYIAAELLGLPPSDAGRLRDWSDSFIVLVDPLIDGAGVKRLRRAYHDLDAYIADAFTAKEKEPGDDLMTRLLEQRESGLLTDLQIRTLTLMLLTAGHEVITNLIGNGVASLLRFPQERERLQSDPELMGSAIEEFIRFESPIQSAWRITTEEFEIDGMTIPPGRAVTVLIGAANRDPRQFDDPNRLDIARADNRHIGFAFGAHYCAGPWLARIEGNAALRRFIERFPHFKAEGDRLNWKPAMGLRGLYELPLSL